MLASGGLLETNKWFKYLCAMFLTDPGPIVTHLNTYGFAGRSGLNNDMALRVAQCIAQQILHDALKLTTIGCQLQLRRHCHMNTNIAAFALAFEFDECIHNRRQPEGDSCFTSGTGFHPGH